MNDIDPQAWPANVLNWLRDHPANKLVDVELETGTSAERRGSLNTRRLIEKIGSRHSSSGSGYCSGASPMVLRSLGYLPPGSLRF
jgi:hypothetical protein